MVKALCLASILGACAAVQVVGHVEVSQEETQVEYDAALSSLLQQRSETVMVNTSDVEALADTLKTKATNGVNSLRGAEPEVEAVTDCHGKWSPWTQCSDDCMRTRTYTSIKVGSKCAFEDQEVQQRPCDSGQCRRPCKGDWTAATECSVNGRTAKVYTQSEHAGMGTAGCNAMEHDQTVFEQACETSLSTVRPEATSAAGGEVDCTYKWSDWSPCSTMCAQSRVRMQTELPPHGKMCRNRNMHGDMFKETRTCNAGLCTQQCEGGFTEWTTCSSQCRQSRMFAVEKKAGQRGLTCLWPVGHVEERRCDTDMCSEDCVGKWTSWGKCTDKCTRDRQYEVFRKASGGGAQCLDPITTLELTHGEGQSQACGDQDCRRDCQTRVDWASECNSPAECRTYPTDELVVAPRGDGTICPRDHYPAVNVDRYRHCVAADCCNDSPSCLAVKTAMEGNTDVLSDSNPIFAKETGLPLDQEKFAWLVPAAQKGREQQEVLTNHLVGLGDETGNLPPLSVDSNASSSNYEATESHRLEAEENEALAARHNDRDEGGHVEVNKDHVLEHEDPSIAAVSKKDILKNPLPLFAASGREGQSAGDQSVHEVQNESAERLGVKQSLKKADASAPLGQGQVDATVGVSKTGASNIAGDMQAAKRAADVEAVKRGAESDARQSASVEHDASVENEAVDNGSVLPDMAQRQSVEGGAKGLESAGRDDSSKKAA